VGNWQLAMRRFRRIVSLEMCKSLPCDVFLGAHGDYYGMIAKYERMEKGKNPFVDPEGYRAYVDSKEKEFRRKLAEQRDGKK